MRQYVILFLLVATTVTALSQDLRLLGPAGRLPDDPDEAQRVRVWIPQEQSTNCRVSVIVLDSAGDTVRHFFDTLLPTGYHNLYWDKRDDSGVKVPAGTYLYELNNCGNLKTGKLEAVYGFWERHSDVLNEPTDYSPLTRLQLTADSALVSMEIQTARGKVLESPFTDSLMMAGVHELVWTPEKKFRSWVYLYLTVGEFQYRRIVKKT